jgi:predicted MFS family arabinose efflux permease
MSTQQDEIVAPDQVAAKPAALGRRFTALLTSTAFANLGDGVVQTGVPLVAAVTLTRSPAEISLLAAAAWLPWLLFGIAGGLIVDRVDRRHAQISALVARAVLLAAGAVVAMAGHMSVPVLIGLLLLYGVTAVIADLGEAAIVPDLVHRDRLAAANGRMLAAQQVASTFLGSPAAGFLLTFGTGYVLGVPAALAVGAALLLLFGVRGKYRHNAAADGEKSNAYAEIRDGLRFLLRHPVMRPMLIAGSLFNMGSTAYTTVLVLWMVGEGSRMGLRPEHFGLLLTLMGIGAVLGSIVAERLIHRVGEVRMLCVTFLSDALLLLVPLLLPYPVPVAVSFLLIGATGNVGNVITQSIRQRMTPKHMLGRITGASRTVSFGLMPLGAIIGGAIGQAFGLPAALLFGTVVCFVALAWVAATIRQRLVDANELPEEPADEALSPAAGA